MHASTAKSYGVRPDTVKSLYTTPSKGTGEVTPRSFASELLKASGINPSPQAIKNVVSWEAQEGGNWKNSARYNPLNTTLNEPGAGNTGSQGNIKVYGSWGQGVKATADTLKNYPGILDALKSGAGFGEFAKAVNSSPWGTKFSGAEPGPYEPHGGPSSTGTTAGNTGITAIPGTKGAGQEEAFNEAGYNKAQSDYTVGKLWSASNPLVAIGGLRTQEPERSEFTSMIPAAPTQSGALGSTGASAVPREANLPNPPANVNLKAVKPPVDVKLPRENQVINSAKGALERSDHHPVSIHELEKAVGYHEAKPPIPTPAGAVHATPKGPIYIPTTAATLPGKKR